MILLLHTLVIIAGTIFFESFLVIKEDTGYGFPLRQILYFHFGNFEDFGHCCNCSCHPLLQLHVSLRLVVEIYFHLSLWHFESEGELCFLCLYSKFKTGLFDFVRCPCVRNTSPSRNVFWAHSTFTFAVYCDSLIVLYMPKWSFTLPINCSI